MTNLFWLEFSLYIGMPVRKWLKGDIDYEELEASYLKWIYREKNICNRLSVGGRNIKKNSTS